MSEALTAPPAVAWAGAMLAPVAELNEQLIELMCAAAGAGTRAPRLLEALREEFSRLGPAARRRLASCPYLLLDAGFARPERWLEPPPARIMDGAGEPGYFMASQGATLVRRALMLAWHLARSSPLDARIVLGMSAACAERIAHWRLGDLEALAERPPGWIAPRWGEQPRVWRQLIGAASQEREAPLRLAQLRGLQLLAAAGGAGVRGTGRPGARPAPLC